ncbi:biotin--[acetyl-CoA-carboxylase] ligase [Schnuerera sp. xch1]|uniref:biotin--[acetyl-CoA-carboxylase] ligase n=1 Tax=Schnuerera sp. xch1 TaxID=2874283 RepID=UPI001CBA7467|nr:biotin--[acetyl-CoA-carboxylase] ligase [Schnuerera sp. xch1]MBZ2175814.1 biotin--[acetyl-CoA-carboxylase] ligase [Schnuerera sp. xch1]
MTDKIDIEEYLKTNFIGKNIEYFHSIPSTNIKAKEIAYSKEEGTIVIAEEQTQGKGRIGRNWASPKGKGIWVSIILKPNMNPDKVPKMTLIGAAAISKALKNMGIKSYIKWPNDIIIGGKKVCGILTEMNYKRDMISYVIMGIGMNVNLDEDDFNDELKDKATSLKITTGTEIDRSKLLASILNYFENLYIPFEEKDDLSETIKISREQSILINREVRIIKGNEEKTGKVLDIDNEGKLVIRYEDDKIEKVFSGEISIRGIKGYV